MVISQDLCTVLYLNRVQRQQVRMAKSRSMECHAKECEDKTNAIHINPYLKDYTITALNKVLASRYGATRVIVQERQLDVIEIHVISLILSIILALSGTWRQRMPRPWRFPTDRVISNPVRSFIYSP